MPSSLLVSQVCSKLLERIFTYSKQERGKYCYENSLDSSKVVYRNTRRPLSIVLDEKGFQLSRNQLRNFQKLYRIQKLLCQSMGAQYSQFYSSPQAEEYLLSQIVLSIREDLAGNIGCYGDVVGPIINHAIVMYHAHNSTLEKKKLVSFQYVSRNHKGVLPLREIAQKYGLRQEKDHYQVWVQDKGQFLAYLEEVSRNIGLYKII